MEKYAVIMGGGSGKRLWPLSRLNRPKQFIDLLGDGPLLTSTIRRLQKSFEGDHIFVVGLQEHLPSLKECIQGLIPEENIILEPSGRNTAACIALTAEHIQDITGSADSVMSIFPADHYIGDVEAFDKVIKNGIQIAEASESVVIIGIEPTFDATGYGYIHLGEPLEGQTNARKVQSFVEKPTKSRATKFFKSGEYLWNGGMFISKTSVMYENIKTHLPDLSASVHDAYLAMQANNDEEAEQLYSQVEKIPIDIGVMEKCKDIVVIPGNFDWSDVGSFYAVHKILKNQVGNAIIEGALFAPQANNLTVYSKKKIVAASGVDDLVIIDMDDVLYICNVKDSEKTKHLVEVLSDFGHDELE